MALTVKVEFDANPTQAGEFVLDSSALDGSDTLTASPRWVDISTLDAAVVTGSIRRGRQTVDNPVQAGECTLVCDNVTGNYDPDNTHGVFYPRLVRGMLCRVSAVVSAVSYVLFTGRLESVTFSKDWNLQATLTFVDDVQLAGSIAMTSFNDAVRPETSESRATWLASMLPMLTTAATISTNLDRSLLPTYGGSSILDNLNLVANAEAGRVFADVNNSLTVTAHVDDITGSVVATLSDDPANSSAINYEALTTSASLTQVVVGSIVDRYSRSDSNYPSKFGGDVGSSWGAVVSTIAPLSSDTDVQALADYLATRRSNPAPSIDSVRVNYAGAEATNGTALLDADIGSQVVTHRSVPYTTGTQTLDLQASLEGIQWDFTATEFYGTFYLATADITSLFGGAGPFILDSSALDGADVLVAY